MTSPFGKTGSNGKSSLAQAVLRRCEALGVVLSHAPGGGLAFDGPAGSMNDGLLAALREYRAELLALLRPVMHSPLILCPWCRSGDRLLDDPEGLQCDRCGRQAWRLAGDAFERIDYVALTVAVSIEVR